MKYLLRITFPKHKNEIIFNSYEELLEYLRKNLTEDHKRYKDTCYLWKYTIKTIKERR